MTDARDATTAPERPVMVPIPADELEELLARYEEAIAALRACEENLRLVHEAAGPLERGAPMPSHCTFDAWRLADEVISRHEERATLAPTTPLED